MYKPENIYHIYNQGNNNQRLFRSHEDYLLFLRMIRISILPFSELLAWCLMPNHFHLMAYTDDRLNTMVKQGGLILDPLTNGLRKLLSGYTRIYNKRYRRSGSLFRQKTKENCLSQNDEFRNVNVRDYYFNCFNYIHQNPVRAGLVYNLEDWEYSSYKDYALLRNGTLCNKELAKKFCGYEPSTFIETSYALLDF